MSVCDREHKQVSKPIERIEISIKPLSKEEVKQKLKATGFWALFEELEDTSYAIPLLISRIAKLLIAYHEDPGTALDKAKELVIEWITEDLMEDIRQTVKSQIEAELEEITDLEEREEIVKRCLK